MLTNLVLITVCVICITSMSYEMKPRNPVKLGDTLPYLFEGEAVTGKDLVLCMRQLEQTENGGVL